jgi:hypothetical protein
MGKKNSNGIWPQKEKQHSSSTKTNQEFEFLPKEGNRANKTPAIIIKDKGSTEICLMDFGVQQKSKKMINRIMMPPSSQIQQVQTKLSTFFSGS